MRQCNRINKYRHNYSIHSTSTSITGAFQTLQFPITSVTRSSTTATVTTPVKHGLDDGQKVILTGADQSNYNGEKTITVASDSTFTFTVSGSPATPAMEQ